VKDYSYEPAGTEKKLNFFAIGALVFIFLYLFFNVSDRVYSSRCLETWDGGVCEEFIRRVGSGE